MFPHWTKLYGSRKRRRSPPKSDVACLRLPRIILQRRTKARLRLQSKRQRQPLLMRPLRPLALAPNSSRRNKLCSLRLPDNDRLQKLRPLRRLLSNTNTNPSRVTSHCTWHLRPRNCKCQGLRPRAPSNRASRFHSNESLKIKCERPNNSLTIWSGHEMTTWKKHKKKIRIHNRHRHRRKYNKILLCGF